VEAEEANLTLFNWDACFVWSKKEPALTGGFSERPFVRKVRQLVPS